MPLTFFDISGSCSAIGNMNNQEKSCLNMFCYPEVNQMNACNDYILSSINISRNRIQLQTPKNYLITPF